MPDITMCSGGGCPLQDQCYRHSATPTPHWQAWFTDVPYNKSSESCKYFWEKDV